MKAVRIALVVALGSMALSAMGCAYGSAVASGTDKVVILRNDMFLFGALRQAFVCKVADNGLTSCASAENP